MKTVEPIRDIGKINQMISELMKSGFRDYLLFAVGIGTGFRISDILKLKVEDVKNKSHITIIEKKTKKLKEAFLYPDLKRNIDKYIINLSDNEYLFKSQKGTNKPISRVQAYRILSKAAKAIGLDSIGTHSLRKTFGYHHYKTNKDVAVLQDLFNHSAPSVTLRYIGINKDVRDESVNNMFSNMGIEWEK